MTPSFTKPFTQQEPIPPVFSVEDSRPIAAIIAARAYEALANG